jgi:hypothetical protein
MKDPKELLMIPTPTIDEFFIGTIDRMFDGFRKTSLFMTAVELRIFDHTENPITAKEISNKVSTDEVMTGMFCSALAEIGLLLKNGDEYVSSDAVRYYLTTDSCLSQFNNIGMMWKRTERWNRLEDVVKNGPQIIQQNKFFNEDWIVGISEGAKGGNIGKVAEYIANNIDVSRYSTFLDLGGGHGLYAIGICSKFDLKGVVFDRADIIPVAEKNIELYGSDVSVQSGDYYTDDIDGKFDIVFSSFTPAGSDIKLIPKIDSVLNRGGSMIIRKHREKVAESAISNLDWNLAIWEGMEKGSKKHGAAFDPKNKQYVDKMREIGIILKKDEIFDDTSEMMIFEKK